MRERSYLGLSAGGFHRVAYAEWGAPDAARTAVCVHGLTRNGRDFDPLAEALAAAGWRVVCPDVVGRGRSDWLDDPAGYAFPQYLDDMAALIARLDAERIDWIGTSMGGLIGMFLAAQKRSPIRRLVLNDVGPFVPRAALERIAQYVGEDPAFVDAEGLEGYLRMIHAGFGDLSDAQWAHLAAHGARDDGDGAVRPAYDPRISVPLRSGPIQDVTLWSIWDTLEIPVLVLRGGRSDLLPAEVAGEMTRRGPRARLAVFEECGHAPALMSADQIAVVRDFLLEE
jgi:pimeloyl-ACP methyl ester carboxylesterase